MLQKLLPICTYFWCLCFRPCKKKRPENILIEKIQGRCINKKVYYSYHSHDLEIRIPFLRNFILIDESTQDPIVGAADGEGEGLIDSVGVFVGSRDGLLLGLGVGVEFSGEADGEGEGLIDSVGVFVGSSLGT